MRRKKVRFSFVSNNYVLKNRQNIFIVAEGKWHNQMMAFLCEHGVYDSFLQTARGYSYLDLVKLFIYHNNNVPAR